MSYYLANEHGFIADFASIGGLAKFRAWGSEPAEPIVDFLTYGETEDTAALISALESASVEGDVVPEMRDALLDAARRSTDVLILTDGTGGED